MKSDHVDNRRQQGSDAPGELKLLTEPLQLAMHPKAKGVNIARIKGAG